MGDSGRSPEKIFDRISAAYHGSSKCGHCFHRLIMKPTKTHSVIFPVVYRRACSATTNLKQQKPVKMAIETFHAAVSCILLVSISLASSCGDDGGSKVKRSPNFGSQSSGAAGVGSKSSSVSSRDSGASQGAPAAAPPQAQPPVSFGRRKRSPNFGTPCHPSQSSKGTNPQGQPIRSQSNRGQSYRGPQPQPSQTG